MKSSSCLNDVIINDVILYLAITLYLDCTTTATHLLFWANRHYQLLHPLVETRLRKIGSIQMTPVDELIMYHAQSFTKESETVASDFSDAD